MSDLCRAGAYKLPTSRNLKRRLECGTHGSQIHATRVNGFETGPAISTELSELKPGSFNGK